MTNHPNRSVGHPARNPSPADVRAAREAAGLTQAQAAALVYASPRNWQQWEQEAGSNARRMHPAIWELFRLKAAA
jgi:DNA (cytosine-5)-methyltransferase 1